MRKNIVIAVATLCMVLWSCSDDSSRVDDIRLNSWMSLLNDTMRVCRLSIPGSHDALTAEGFTDSSFINDYTTQVATFEEQLNGGVRYFDIRLLMRDDPAHPALPILQACHRTAPIRLTFDDVLARAEKFLKDNPSEFLIIKIQYDGRPMTDEDRSNWISAVQRTLHETPNSEFFVPFKPDIRVSEMRGKILLLSRTDYGDPFVGAMTNWFDEGGNNYLTPDFRKEHNLFVAPTPAAVQPSGGGNSPGAARLYVQDFYNSVGNRISSKLKAVQEMFLSSQQLPPNSDVWILSHTSGFSSPKMNALGYAENASKTNALMLDLLRKDKSHRGVGIIAMDYACIDTLDRNIGTLGTIRRAVMSKSLTRAIVEHNL